jgi:hypothetical protein
VVGILRTGDTSLFQKYCTNNCESTGNMAYGGATLFFYVCARIVQKREIADGYDAKKAGATHHQLAQC